MDTTPDYHHTPGIITDEEMKRIDLEVDKCIDSMDKVNDKIKRTQYSIWFVIHKKDKKMNALSYQI